MGFRAMIIFMRRCPGGGDIIQWSALVDDSTTQILKSGTREETNFTPHAVVSILFAFGMVQSVESTSQIPGHIYSSQLGLSSSPPETDVLRVIQELLVIRANV